MTHANLTPERGPSIWERQAHAAQARDRLERTVVAAAGLLLLVVGLRGRTGRRRVVAGAGAALLAVAGAPRGLDRVRAWTDRQRWRLTRRDLVTEQSAESFPASDSPAWTATTGSPFSGGTH